MDALTLPPPRNDSLPTGVMVSIALHVVLVAYILFEFSRPQPLAPPVDLAGAIPISMEFFRPKPPEPPKVEPKPQTPKSVVTTTAPEPDVQVEEAPADPSPAPAPEPQETRSAAPGTPSYASIVAGILQRAKRYPREALREGLEGVVIAHFVVNRQGHVIGYRIEQSSRVRELDNEVVALLKRVRFPPIPDDGGDPERRSFSLPISFKIAEG